jgi:hypothetical protein
MGGRRERTARGGRRRLRGYAGLPGRPQTGPADRRPEANARPGVANRLAARMTTYLFAASPSVRLAHATAIGIPLRPAITGLDRAALRDAARGSACNPTGQS